MTSQIWSPLLLLIRHLAVLAGWLLPIPATRAAAAAVAGRCCLEYREAWRVLAVPSGDKKLVWRAVQAVGLYRERREVTIERRWVGKRLTS
jgi:hypothetical protein